MMILLRSLPVVLLHPSLWPTAWRELRALIPNGWWRRKPWLPVPDPAYLRFRLVTQYGDESHAPDPTDLLTWLRWCRALDRSRDA